MYWVFACQDANNYLFASMNSLCRSTETGSGTYSFAIGRVVGGANTWMTHGGTFATSSGDDIYEAQSDWQPAADGDMPHRQCLS